MYKNPLKEKLKSRQPLAGCLLQGALPAMVEICGLAGMDFVFIDAEHGPLSERDCEELVRAAEIRNTVPIVRPPDCEHATILRYLDIGAMGVILPSVNSKEEAEKGVKAVKYYPRGIRGLSASRASDYGLRKPMFDYVVEANQETIVWAMIEKVEALENLEEILTVDGIDGLILGTSDLSQSLGVPGKGQDAKVTEAYNRFVRVCSKADMPMGAVVRPWETVQQHLDAGVTILLSVAYGLFAGAAKNYVAQFKK
jgi:4-hydroxy-2-oxoheptanedioate aldolase